MTTIPFWAGFLVGASALASLIFIYTLGMVLAEHRRQREEEEIFNRSRLAHWE